MVEPEASRSRGLFGREFSSFGRAGSELWNALNCHWARRRQRKQRISTDGDLDSDVLQEFSGRIRQLVHSGMPSRACKTLLSRGVAEDTPETHAAVKQLLPNIDESLGLDSMPLSDFSTEVAASDVYSVLVKCKRGLAPGPSGLRTDHLHDIMELIPKVRIQFWPRW